MTIIKLHDCGKNAIEECNTILKKVNILVQKIKFDLFSLLIFLECYANCIKLTFKS